jgi:hypothetical protein
LLPNTQNGFWFKNKLALPVEKNAQLAWNRLFGEWLKEWAKFIFATHLPWRTVPGENTEIIEKNL